MVFVVLNVVFAVLFDANTGGADVLLSSRVRIDAETICLHGDTPGAVAFAQAVRDRLESSGVPLAPL